jgi:hypothetical protein
VTVVQYDPNLSRPKDATKNQTHSLWTLSFCFPTITLKFVLPAHIYLPRDIFGKTVCISFPYHANYISNPTANSVIWHSAMLAGLHKVWTSPLRNNSILGGAKICLLSTTTRPFQGPSQSPVQWERSVFCVEVKRLKREADHSPPSSAKITNEWRFTSTPPPQFLCLDRDKSGPQKQKDVSPVLLYWR